MSLSRNEGMMMKLGLATTACVLVSIAVPASAAALTKAERLRQQAARVCYDDAQRLCGDVASDESQVKSCMAANRAQLSPPCRKAFEAGQKSQR